MSRILCFCGTIVDGCDWMAVEMIGMLYPHCHFQRAWNWQVDSAQASSSLHTSPNINVYPPQRNSLRCHSANRWPKATTLVSSGSSLKITNCVPLHSFISTYCGKQNSTPSQSSQVKVSPGWILSHKFTLPSE